ncbi:hypothetical protein G6L37_05255 [Agrobacterium rubi]|nr:hypothetical protein [Agrobacterium rubi]NTF24764.1 hypothetical protein [Agrobacterium rubi]
MRFPRLHDRVNGRFIGIEIHGKHEGRLWHHAIVGLPLWIGERLNAVRLWTFYRIHPKHRYNRVNLRLPARYYENDTRLLHAMFAVLCDHVEEDGRKNIEELIVTLESEIESGDCGISEEAIIRQVAIMREKLALHDWWTIERPTIETLRRDLCRRCYDVKPYEAVPDPENAGKVLTKRQLGERLRRMDDDLDERDQKMCHRLVDIRQCLWT